MLVRANKRLGAGSIDVFYPQYKLKYELIQIFWQWASCKPVTLFSGLFSKEPFLTERLETISRPGTGPMFYLTLYTWSNEECSRVGGRWTDPVQFFLSSINNKGDLSLNNAGNALHLRFCFIDRILVLGVTYSWDWKQPSIESSQWKMYGKRPHQSANRGLEYYPLAIRNEVVGVAIRN